MITVQEFEDKYSGPIAELLDDFQGYLVDLDPLKRLRRPEHYGQEVLGDTLRELEKKGGSFLLAVDRETVVGFIVGVLEEMSRETKRSVIPTSKPGRVIELYVDTAYREAGIGTTLMQQMEHFFRRQGCDAVHVVVFAPNTPAKHLYERLGYTDRELDLIKIL